MKCYACDSESEACHVLTVSPFVDKGSILYSFGGMRVPLCSIDCIIELVRPQEEA